MPTKKKPKKYLINWFRWKDLDYEVLQRVSGVAGDETAQWGRIKLHDDAGEADVDDERDREMRVDTSARARRWMAHGPNNDPTVSPISMWAEP
jgi:hypothetical protein